MCYVLLLSQMSKLQFCLESNSAAIFQLNLLPGKIFLASNWEFLFGNWEKGGYFGLGMGPIIGPW